MEILNMPLLKNPLNWFIIFFMVVIAGIGFHFVVKLFQLSGSSSAANVANPIDQTTGV